jgi:hypothetical protein
MSYESAIDRGVELLRMCRHLQEQCGAVDRPAPDPTDTPKVLESIWDSITILEAALRKLLPMQQRLAEVGRELERQGRLNVEDGDDYSVLALEHLLGENRLGPGGSFPATDLWVNL